jgi:hypothetical protein
MTILGLIVLAFIAVSWFICWRLPAFALVLVLVFYPLKQVMATYITFFAHRSYAFNILAFIGVGIAAVSVIVSRPRPLLGFRNGAFVSMWILYLFALFSILYSPGVETATELARGGYPYWIAQMLLLPLVISDIRDAERIWAPFLLIGSAVVLLVLVNPYARYYGGRLVLDIGPLVGLHQYFGNPLATAQLGGHLAIVGALMLPRRAGWLFSLVRLAVVFLGLGIAAAAGSRGQMILAAAVMVACYPLARRVRSPRHFFASAVGFATILAVAYIAVRFFLAQDIEQSRRWDIGIQIEVLSRRAATAWQLIDTWASNPLAWPFGLGAGAFAHLTTAADTPYAHNFYIEALGEQGLIGLTLALLITYYFYRDSRDLWRTHREEPQARAGASVLIALALYNFLLGMKQGTYVSIPDSIYLAAILANLATRLRADHAAPNLRSVHEDLPVEYPPLVSDTTHD